MIFYFSGTGNSKSIANLFKRELNEEIFSINQSLKENTSPSIQEGEHLIFIMPTYSWRIPKIVKNWIKNNIYLKNGSIYYILTCGDDIGNADAYLEKFTKKLGLNYMGTTELIMPENYLVMFDTPSDQESLEIIKEGEKNALAIIEEIKQNKVIEKKKKTTFVDKLKSGIVNFFFNLFYVSDRKFKYKDSCISCGKCSAVCPTNNVTLINGKPKWNKKCCHCMACICHCPTNAIEYGKNSVNRNRYLHPDEK